MKTILPRRTGKPARADPKTRKRQQRGSILIELLVGVLVFGVLSAALTPIMRSVISMNDRAYDERHKLNNALIGSALMTVASTSQLGRLPAPATSGSHSNSIYNPSDTSPIGLALTAALIQSGLNMNEVNDDGRAAALLRVYQSVSPDPLVTPLYFQNGPLVQLRYDVGVIYLTKCAKANTSCNPNPVTGIAGDSPRMTQSNFATWSSSGTDGPAFYVSSLPVQKMMLSNTVQRLERIRDAMLSYLRTQQLTASGSDTTNWYPNQNGLSSPGNRAGMNPMVNQGCRDGWYRLDDAASQILPRLGLSTMEYGKTAWGGSIEYCRDYDPTGSQNSDEPPHYGALRISSDVSSGQPPHSLPGNNVVLTF